MASVLGGAKIVVQKGGANHRDTSAFGMVQGFDCHIRANNPVLTWPACLQLVQERSGGTTHVQHRALATMLPKQP